MTLPRRHGYTYNSISILLPWGCHFETRFEIATNASKIITVAFPFPEDSITQSQVKAAEPSITESLFCHDVIANVPFDPISIHLQLFFFFFSFFVEYSLVEKVEIRNRKIYRQTAEREKTWHQPTDRSTSTHSEIVERDESKLYCPRSFYAEVLAWFRCVIFLSPSSSKV